MHPTLIACDDRERGQVLVYLTLSKGGGSGDCSNASHSGDDQDIPDKVYSNDGRFDEGGLGNLPSTLPKGK